MKKVSLNNVEIKSIADAVTTFPSNILDKLVEGIVIFAEGAAIVTDISSHSGVSETLLKQFKCSVNNGSHDFELTLFAPVKFNNLEQVPNREITISVPVMPVETEKSDGEITFIVNAEFAFFTEDENQLRSAVFKVVGFDENSLNGFLSFLNVSIARENLKNSSGL